MKLLKSEKVNQQVSFGQPDGKARGERRWSWLQGAFPWAVFMQGTQGCHSFLQTSLGLWELLWALPAKYALLAPLGAHSCWEVNSCRKGLCLAGGGCVGMLRRWRKWGQGSSADVVLFFVGTHVDGKHS